MLAAKIYITSSKVWLTVHEDGEEMFRQQYASRATAEMAVNALESNRGQQVSLTVESE